MAVYEHTYRRYTGAVTPQWTRFLVVARYIFKDVFQSKLLVFFFALCFAFPLACIVTIWIGNSEIVEILETGAIDALDIDAAIFKAFMWVQGGCAFFLTLLVGPGLISRDLANNGLPLYLCRPISRAEYVLGKISVLAILLSSITWMPGFLLYALQSHLDKDNWMTENLGVLTGMFVGFWVTILVLALLILALSAWLKWRPVAAFMMVMIFLTGSFISLVLNGLFRTDWGHITNPFQLFSIVWSSLLGTEIPAGPPVPLAWLGLAALAGFSLLMLHAKIRAYEVVR